MADTTSTGNTTPDQATPTDTTPAQSTGETVQLAAAAAAVQVSAPARGTDVSITVEPGQTVELKDPVLRFTQDGGDLVIHWANLGETHTTVVGALAAGTPLVLADGTTLSSEQVIAQIEGFDPGAIEVAVAAVEPAAGVVPGAAAGGAFNTPFDNGTLGPPADVTNLLLGTELQFGLIEAAPELDNETLAISLRFITVTDTGTFIGGFEDWQPDQNVCDFDEFPMRLDISGSGPIAFVVISDIPNDVDVFIGDPFGTAEPSPGSGTYSVTVQAADLDSIFFRPPDDSDVDFAVTVTATGFNSVVTSASVTAVVDAVADLPDVGFSGAGISEGGVQTMNFDIEGGEGGSPPSYTEGDLTVFGVAGDHLHLNGSDLRSHTGPSDVYQFEPTAGGTFSMFSFEVTVDSGSGTMTSSTGAVFNIPNGTGTFNLPSGFQNVDFVRFDLSSGGMNLDNITYSLGGGGAAATGALFGLSSSTGGLYRIDADTGAASFVTNIEDGDLSASITGLSFLNGTLFATDIFGGVPSGFNIGTLGSIDGAFAFINDQDGSSNWFGLATDETNNLLYTIDFNDDGILKSMTAGGTVTSIGTGTGIIGQGMAFDDANGILYATDSIGDLYTVDTTTGEATLIGPTGISGSIGLAYDENTNTLFANDGNALFTLDTVTGASFTVGLNFVDGIDGLAWIDPTCIKPGGPGFVAVWDSPDGDQDGAFFRIFDADGNPITGDIRANQTTAGDQEDAEVTVLSNGNLVVTWEDNGVGDVFARVFDSSGNAVTDQFVVNETTAFDQDDPAATALADSKFAIVWEGGEDGGPEGVFVRVFDFDGTALTGQIQVNTGAGTQFFDPAITTLTNGNFVVSWESDSPLAIPGREVLVRIFDNTGAAVTGEIVVNQTTVGVQEDSHVTALAGGRFVVTWEDESGTDGDGEGVFARVFEANGTAVTGEFQVNQTTAGDQDDVSATGLAGGGFVVTWEDPSQDGSSNAAMGRLFDADGNALGDEFQINQSTFESQDEVDVAPLPGGGFIVTWEDTGGADGDGSGIFARIYDDQGIAQGNEFQINLNSTGNQEEPEVAFLPSTDSSSTGGFFTVTYNEDNAFGEGQQDCLTDADPIFGAGFTAAVTDTDGSERIKTIVIGTSEEATGDPDLPDNPVDSLGLRDPLSGDDDPTATNFLIGGVVVTDETIVGEDVVDTIVQVSATFFAIDASGNVLSGVPATVGLVDAHVNFDGNAMTLNFEVDGDGNTLNAGIQIQSVDLSGTSSTNFEVRLPQHSDDDFQLRLDVTVTENPPTDAELTFDNNEATQTTFLNVEVQAVADEAVINFNPFISILQTPQFTDQVFDFVEDDTLTVPAHENPLPPVAPPIVPPAHGDASHEEPLRIPLTFVAELTDVDGSESIAVIQVELFNGIDPGAKFVDETGADLVNGGTTTIDGVSFDVGISGQTLTLTANPPAPGMDINMGGEVQIELPIDDSSDFSATFSVTTTEFNAEGDPHDASCTVSATRDFDIEGVVGPAATDNGFGAYSEGSDDGLVTTSLTAPSVVIDFETRAHDGTVVFTGDPYNEDGFTLNNISTEGSDFFVVGSGDPRHFGSASFGNSFPGDATQLMREGGGEFKTFDMLSIDLAENELPGQPNVTFFGIRSAGLPPVQQTFTLDGIAGGETFVFNPSLFSNLISVTWDQGDSASAHIFDNIVVEPVVDGLVSFFEDAQPNPLLHGPNADESNLIIELRYTASTQDDDGTGPQADANTANERNSEGITELVITLDGADPGAQFSSNNGAVLSGAGILDLGLTTGNPSFVLSGPNDHTLTLTFADPGVQDVDLQGGFGLEVKLPIDDSTDFRVNYDVTTTEWDDDAFDGTFTPGNGNPFEFPVDGTTDAPKASGTTTVVHDDINFEIQGVVGPADTDTNDDEYTGDTGFLFGGQLFGLSSATDDLYRVDSATGAATFITDIDGGALGAAATGLSFLNSTLFATDIFGGGLSGFNIGTVDITNGAFAFINDQDGSSDWFGLATDETTSLLYSIDIDDNDILKSMTAGGTVTSIGTGTGIGGFAAGMAFDDANGILYAIDSNGDLYTVDTTTGVATLVGSTGLASSVFIGLAYDENTNTLFANEDDTDSLYVLDTGTGAATLVGANGFDGIDGLAWLDTGNVSLVEDGTTVPSEHGPNADETNLLVNLRYEAHTQDDDSTTTPAAPDSASERNSEGITQMVITLNDADPGDVFVKADGSALNGDGSIVLGDGVGGAINGTYVLSGPDGHTLTITFADPGVQDVDLFDLAGGDGLSVELPIDDSTDFSVTYDTTTTEWDDDNFDAAGTFFDNESVVAVPTIVTTDTIEFEIQGQVGPADTPFGDYSGEADAMFAAPVDDGNNTLTLRFFEDGDEDSLLDPEVEGIDGNRAGPLVVQVRMTATAQDDDGTGTPAANDEVNERNSEAVTEITINLTGADPGAFFTSGGTALGASGTLDLGLGTANPSFVVGGTNDHILTFTFPGDGVQSVDLAGGDGIAVEVPMDSDIDFSIGIRTTTREYDDDGSTVHAPPITQIVNTIDVIVDAVADVPHVILDVNDGGGDTDSEFSPNEIGIISVNVDFGDVDDGSETHTLTVDLPAGFTVFGGFPLPGLPAGVTAIAVGGDVEFTAATGVSGFNYSFNVQAPGSISDNTSFPFTATARAVETPAEPGTESTDVPDNNDAENSDDENVPGSEAGIPTVGFSLDGVSFLKEDTPADAIITAATTTVDDTLTQIVIEAPAGWMLGATVGGDISGVGGDGTNVLTLTVDADGSSDFFPNVETFSETITVQAPENSDVDGALTVTATAVDGFDTVTGTGASPFDVTVDAVVDGSEVTQTATAAGDEGTIIDMNLAIALGGDSTSLALNPDPDAGHPFTQGGTDTDGSELVTEVEATLSAGTLDFMSLTGTGITVDDTTVPGTWTFDTSGAADMTAVEALVDSFGVDTTGLDVIAGNMTFNAPGSAQTISPDFTEGLMTVTAIGGFAGAVPLDIDHVHLGDRGGDSTGDLFNHAGTASDTYEFTLAGGVPFTMVSFDVVSFGGVNGTFEAFDGSTSLGTFVVTGLGPQTLPSSFADATRVVWTQAGSLVGDGDGEGGFPVDPTDGIAIDNLIYTAGDDPVIDIHVETLTVDIPTDTEDDFSDNFDVDTYDFTVGVFDTAPRVLNGFINTNSSLAGQELRLTLTEVNNSANTFAAILTLQLQGGQAQALINLDAGFDIDPGTEYVATLDWVGAGGSGIDFIEITEFVLEDVTIVGAGGGSPSVTLGTDEPVSDNGLTAVIDPATELVAGPAPFDPDDLDNRLYGDGLVFTAVPAVPGVDAPDTLFGVGDDDVLFGGDDPDELYGDVQDVNFLFTVTGGDDLLIGGVGGGFDFLFGDARDVFDFAQVTGGNDTLLGGGGKDFLFGDVQDVADNAVVFGGNDMLRGGGFSNTLFGDAQDLSGFAQVTGGDDTLIGGDGVGIFGDGLIGDVADAFDNAHVIGGNDILLGSDAEDFLFGDATRILNSATLIGGDDMLDGGAGDDDLFGDARVIGPSATFTGGDDTLTGGLGDDTFNYVSVDDGNDLITDYSDVLGDDDTVDLDALFVALGGFADADARAAAVNVDNTIDQGFGTGAIDTVLTVDDSGGILVAGFSITFQDVTLPSPGGAEFTAAELLALGIDVGA